MKMHKVFYFLFLMLCLLIRVSTVSADPLLSKQVIKVCAEDAGWPPFSFPADELHPEFSGLNKDLLQYISEKQGIQFEVVIRPWKRCLLDAIGGDVQLVLDAAKNPEREEKYLLTAPVYTLTPAFLYHKKNIDRYTVPVASADLQKLKAICGQQGYIYNNFGFESERVNMVSKDLKKILDLTLAERCDIGLARKEVLLTELKNYAQRDLIGVQEVSQRPKEKFYWLINKRYEHAERLKEVIDLEVGLLHQQKEFDQLLAKYFK